MAGSHTAESHTSSPTYVQFQDAILIKSVKLRSNILKLHNSIVFIDSLFDHKWLHWFTCLSASYWPVLTHRSHSLVKNTNNSSNQPFIKPPGLELAIFCRCWKWKPALDQFDHHDISSLWWTQYFTINPSNKEILDIIILKTKPSFFTRLVASPLLFNLKCKTGGLITVSCIPLLFVGIKDVLQCTAHNLWLMRTVHFRNVFQNLLCLTFFSNILA